MKKEKGTITIIDLFDRIHRKRSSSEEGSSKGGDQSSGLGEHITAKTGRVAEDYTTASIQKFGEDTSSHLPIDPVLWELVAGGGRKGRLYCFGSFLIPSSC